MLRRLPSPGPFSAVLVLHQETDSQSLEWLRNGVMIRTTGTLGNPYLAGVVTAPGLRLNLSYSDLVEDEAFRSVEQALLEAWLQEAARLTRQVLAGECQLQVGPALAMVRQAMPLLGSGEQYQALNGLSRHRKRRELPGHWNECLALATSSQVANQLEEAARIRSQLIREALEQTRLNW